MESEPSFKRSNRLFPIRHSGKSGRVPRDYSRIDAEFKTTCI
jgi:hypothetical protein